MSEGTIAGSGADNTANRRPLLVDRRQVELAPRSFDGLADLIRAARIQDGP